MMIEMEKSDIQRLLAMAESDVVVGVEEYSCYPDVETLDFLDRIWLLVCESRDDDGTETFCGYRKEAVAKQERDKLLSRIPSPFDIIEHRIPES